MLADFFGIPILESITERSLKMKRRRSKKSPASVWHVVYQPLGLVLAVYGASLKDEAEARASRLRETYTFIPIKVATVRGPRPSTGLVASSLNLEGN